GVALTGTYGATSFTLNAQAAVTATFIGGGGTLLFNSVNVPDWSSAANWSTGTVPNATTDVIIPAAFAGTGVVIAQNTQDSAHYNVNSVNASAPVILVNAGKLYLAADSTFTSLVLSSAASNVLSGGGNVAISGLLDWGA